MGNHIFLISNPNLSVKDEINLLAWIFWLVLNSSKYFFSSVGMLLHKIQWSWRSFAVLQTQQPTWQSLKPNPANPFVFWSTFFRRSCNLGNLCVILCRALPHIALKVAAYIWFPSFRHAQWNDNKSEVVPFQSGYGWILLVSSIRSWLIEYTAFILSLPLALSWFSKYRFFCRHKFKNDNLEKEKA